MNRTSHIPISEFLSESFKILIGLPRNPLIMENELIKSSAGDEKCNQSYDEKDGNHGNDAPPLYRVPDSQQTSLEVLGLARFSIYMYTV
jgi:hypothetical protein